MYYSKITECKLDPLLALHRGTHLAAQHMLFRLARVKRHESVVREALHERVSARRVFLDWQARCIPASTLKVARQPWNFKQHGHPVASLNFGHGVVECPTMQVVCIAIWQPQESDVVGPGNAGHGC